MILLTGASGFIGSYLLKELIEKYGSENVLALTSKPIKDCKYLLHDNYSFDPDFFLKNGFGGINTIVHAGAFIPKSSDELNDVIKCTSNISNTIKLISARLPNLKNFIFLSTVDVYGHDDVVTEKSIAVPVSLYGDSKLYCERMIYNWSIKNDISCKILRIGHVYGPGEEKYKKLIPLVIKQALNAKNVKIFGSGDDIRTFIYIEDVVHAIINSLEIKSSLVNVVGEEKVSIRNLIEKIIEISNSTSNVERVDSTHAVRNLVFDNSKLKELLHVPAYSLEEGLKKEIEYFQNI